MKIRFDGIDNDWEAGSSVSWYTLNGTDYGTGYLFVNAKYGVSDDGDFETFLDSDGNPLVEGDNEAIAVHNQLTGRPNGADMK